MASVAGAVPRSELHYPVPASPQYPRLLDRDARSQWARIERFLERCTDSAVAALGAGESITLTITTGDLHGSETDLEPLLERARSEFGAEDAAALPFINGVLRTWGLQPAQLPAAVALVESSERPPVSRLAPVLLSTMRRFRWRDPSSGALLPGQRPLGTPPVGEPPSYLSLSVGRDAFAAGEMAFPFAEVESPFIAYLAAMVPLLPFAFHSRHLRAMSWVAAKRRYGSPRKLSREEVALLSNVIPKR